MAELDECIPRRPGKMGANYEEYRQNLQEFEVLENSLKKTVTHRHELEVRPLIIAEAGHVADFRDL